jgi:hypothetical protein
MLSCTSGKDTAHGVHGFPPWVTNLSLAQDGTPFLVHTEFAFQDGGNSQPAFNILSSSLEVLTIKGKILTYVFAAVKTVCEL